MSKRKKASPRFMIIMGLIFLAVGVGVSLWGVSVLRHALASTAWPTVDGHILSSDVERHRSSSGSGGSSTTYHADVVYRYTVNGQTLENDQVSFGEYGSSNSSHAHSIVRRYPVGKAVAVHYHPDRPGVSCLEPGTTWASYMPLGFGALFAVVGGAVMAGGVRARHRSSLAESTPPDTSRTSGEPEETENPYRQIQSDSDG